MANFQGHITTSAALGIVVGAFGSFYLHYDWGAVFLAAGLTTIGGMLPDLDSDSGIPVRELFSLAAVLVPILLLERLQRSGLGTDQMLVLLGGSYLVVRYGIAALFKRLTVHRGMFHSIPALLIAGLAVFLMYHPTEDALRKRMYFATGTMIGFFSHLALDELFAVNLMGVVPRLNKFAGSALKLTSASWTATLVTYAILLALGFLTWLSLGTPSVHQLIGTTSTAMLME
jgi:hypothetical protein